MDYALLNTIGITVLALFGLWIFSRSVVEHPQDKKKQDNHPHED